MSNMDYITLGPTPPDEDCVQVGADDYRKLASIEMEAFIEQLYREFPDASNNNVVIKKMWFNHDFGKYGEVVAVFDMSDGESVNYAFKIEREMSHYWDDQSIQYLRGAERALEG